MKTKTTKQFIRVPTLNDKPWPDPGSEFVELNTFNGRPSTGLVPTAFGAQLFWQFSGHGSGIGMWFYLPLSDSEAEYIVDHLDEPLLDGIRTDLTGHQGILALSRSGRIWARGPYVFGPPTSSSSLIMELLRALASGLEQAQPELPSGRRVEMLAGSNDLREDATNLVHATLAGCGA